jgi:hypothetical protein
MAKLVDLTVGTAKFADFAITGYAKALMAFEGTGVNPPISATLVASNEASLPVFVNANVRFNYQGTSTGSSSSYTVTLSRIRGAVTLASKNGGFSGNGNKTGGANFSVPDPDAQPGDTYKIRATYASGGGAEGGSIQPDLANDWISVLYVKK